jgi:hypothetical protein
LLLGILLASVELASRIVLAVRPTLFGGLAASRTLKEERLAATVERVLQDDPGALATFDADLGWTVRRASSDPQLGISAQGLRSARLYEVPRPADRLRVAAFGDSFVFGSEVDPDEGWTHRIEQLADVEVLNYGVPGYGQDQITLRYFKEGDDLQPQVVLFGVSPPTLERLLSVAGWFRTPAATDGQFICKPRYCLDPAGNLVLEEMPFKSRQELQALLAQPESILALGQHDFWYEPMLYESKLVQASACLRIGFAGWAKLRQRYVDPDRPIAGPSGAGIFNIRSSSFTILMRLLESCSERAKARGTRPIALLLPDGYSVDRILRGKGSMLAPVASACEQEGLELIDVSQALADSAKKVGVDALFIHRFHLNAEGNDLVARVILDALRSRALKVAPTAR